LGLDWDRIAVELCRQTREGENKCGREGADGPEQRRLAGGTLVPKVRTPWGPCRPQRPVDVAASCREGPDGNEALAHLPGYLGTRLSREIASADRYLLSMYAIS
jgi:hypothetical protein